MTEQQTGSAPPKVLLAILHMGSVCTSLSQWVTNVAASETRYPIMIQWFGGDAEAVPHSSNRNRIMRDTPGDFAGVLMLDSDTVPHPQTMDIPLLGENIVIAPTPIWRADDERGPVVTNMIPFGADSGNMDHATFQIGRPVLQRVKEGGTGCIYISRVVLDHPGMRGAFKFEFDDDGVTVVGEDHSFCRVATECGFEVYAALGYPQGHMKAVNLSIVWDMYHPVEGRKPLLIVTGSGRNGSGYAKARLAALGVKIGHETIFMYRGLDAAKERLARFQEVVADSSWMAAPYLDCAFCEKALIIHQVRHPGKVIASWIREPTQTTPRYWQFVLRYLPMLAEIEGDLERCAARYVLWNGLIENKLEGREYYRWRVEDGANGDLAMLQWLVSKEALTEDRIMRPFIANRTLNRHGAGEPQFVPLDTITGPWGERVRDMAERYGYEDV